MAKKFVASDKFIAWASSLSGMLTSIKTEYGGIAEMVESAQWDEGKTEYAIALLDGLRREVADMHKELESHVAEKFGKDGR